MNSATSRWRSSRQSSTRRTSSSIASGRPGRLVLASEHRQAILAHAAETEVEVCGVIVGHGETASRVIRCRNAARDPRTAFAIEPLDLRDIFLELDRTGERLLAYYHSHPPAARAEPSHTDIRDARRSGEHRWALFVLAHGGDVAAFAIDDESIHRVEVVAG